MLVDSGADISIMKISEILGKTDVDTNESITFKGIGSEELKSFGISKSEIIFSDKWRVKQNFHIISDKVPIKFSGILGMDFLNNNKTLLDFGSGRLLIPDKTGDFLEIQMGGIQSALDENLETNIADKVDSKLSKKNRTMNNVLLEKFIWFLLFFMLSISRSILNKHKSIIVEDNIREDETNSGKVEVYTDEAEKSEGDEEQWIFVEAEYEDMSREFWETIEDSVSHDEVTERDDENDFIDDERQERSCVIIPPISEKIIEIDNLEEGQFVCENVEIQNGVFVECGLITTDSNRKAYVNVINTRNEEYFLSRNQIKIKSNDDYRILRFAEIKVNAERAQTIMKEMNTTGLNSEEQEGIFQICNNYGDIFYANGDKLTYCDEIKHSIPTTNEAPIFVKQYRIPQMQKIEINKKLVKMLDEGIIKESNSPWNSPAILVEKKSESGEKKWRLVIDFRKLNDISKGDSFPIPNINEILDQLGGAKYFSTLDLASGYHQLLMAEEDREKTAFSTDSNHYEWIRMPMGLKNSGRTFQRLMNMVLSGLIGEDCFVYLDDIVVYGKNLLDHNEKMSRVLERLKHFNLKLQPEKCKFLRKEVIYLGHLITGNGIKPDPAKISCVENYPKLKTGKDVKSFLGLVGYYRRFIDNFATIAKPLTQLLRKNVPFNWSTKCQEAFDKLKEILVSPTILQYPDFEKEFIITTDSSGYAISAILSQGEIGKDLPVAYASRTMNDAETRYSTSEQEMLAVVWGVQQYRPYVWGRKFKIVTDHRALMWIFSVKDPTSRLFRWKIRLAEYHYEVIHKKGKMNSNADALSRIRLPETNVNVVTRAKAKLIEITGNDDHEEIRDNRNIKPRIKNKNNLKENLRPGVWEKEFSISNTQVQNKVHLIAPNANILDQLTDHNVREPDMGEVVHRTKNKKNDFYLVVKDPENADIHFENLFSALNTLKLLLNEKNITEVGLISSKSTFENMDISRVKRIIENIFEASNIEFIIYVYEILELTDEDQIKKIITELHYTKIGGHIGVNRLEKRIKQFYEFRNMRKKIEEIVLNCEECQKNKITRKTKMPLVITTTAKHPFEKIAMDIVGPLPETYLGNKYLLTCQDDLTKYAEAIPLPNQEADTIAKAFVKFIILKHSSPESILTDNGSNFVSKLFQNTCKLLGIKRNMISPYHPESNGALERTHRTFKEFLRAYINNERDNWDEMIQYGVYVFNTTPHTSTSYSPHELLYGMKPNLPNALKGKVQTIYNYDDYIYELKYRMQKAHCLARENQIKNKERSKDHYDKKANQDEFKVGQLVLMENCCVTGQGRKLQPLYTGPYEIIDCPTSVNSEIKISKNKTKVVHNNLLKKFRSEG